MADNNEFKDESYTPEHARYLLQDFTVKQLRASCRVNVVKYRGMSKSEMIEALILADDAVVRD